MGLLTVCLLIQLVLPNVIILSRTISDHINQMITINLFLQEVFECNVRLYNLQVQSNKVQITSYKLELQAPSYKLQVKSYKYKL
jgi:hypothetical protein